MRPSLQRCSGSTVQSISPPQVKRVRRDVVYQYGGRVALRACGALAARRTAAAWGRGGRGAVRALRRRGVRLDCDAVCLHTSSVLAGAPPACARLAAWRAARGSGRARARGARVAAGRAKRALRWRWCARSHALAAGCVRRDIARTSRGPVKLPFNLSQRTTALYCI